MTCYVCKRAVEDVPLHRQMEASRAMNVPVVIGLDRSGALLVRHSYCAPGTERWLSAMMDGRTLSDADRIWVARFLEGRGDA